MHIPTFEQYGLCPKRGFLPHQPPLVRLGPEFEPWEKIMDSYNGLLLAGRLRDFINKLPVLEADLLAGLAEQQRAFLVLCLLSHGYVWGKHEPVLENLPSCLAIPWTKVAEKLGLRPVTCHAAVILWNWKLLEPDAPWDLSHFSILHTFSGAMDEAWFYLITTAIESRGAVAISLILDALKETHSSTTNWPRLKQTLAELSETIEALTEILLQMYAKCDPYVFFWKVRAYLAGWSNMAIAGLPNGLHYEGADPPGVYRRYPGGSAGQSPLLHLLDVALSVKHHQTGEQTGHNSFIRTMREHMHGPHRAFLEAVEKVCNIREYIQESLKCTDQLELVQKTAKQFDDCANALKVFRDKHIQMVTLYVVLPARKGPAMGGRESVVGQQGKTQNGQVFQTNLDGEGGGGGIYPQEAVATVELPDDVKDENPLLHHAIPKSMGIARLVKQGGAVRGTGGTDLLPFLKQMRDETNESKILPEDD